MNISAVRCGMWMGMNAGIFCYCRVVGSKGMSATSGIFFRVDFNCDSVISCASGTDEGGETDLTTSSSWM